MFVKILVLQYLWAIQGVETNHGKDLNHRTISSIESIHYGDTAIGNWAVMPNTVTLLKGDVGRFRTDLIYQKALTKKYALKVLQAAKGCPLKASVLWLKGPAAKPTLADYQTPRYYRFVKEWEFISGIPIHEDPIIKRYCK